jgi:hypothetical protein
MFKRGVRIVPLAVLAVSLAATAGVQAALSPGSASPLGSEFRLGETSTCDARDTVATYLNGQPAKDCGGAVSLAAAGDQDFSVPRWTPTRTVLHAPAQRPAEVHLVTFAYPDVKGLVDGSNDERAVPLGDAAMLGMGPGGYGHVMSGRPSGRAAHWSDTVETSISYVRPHINTQMVVALEIPSVAGTAAFEGLGLDSRAYMDIGHLARVDSASLGGNSDRFGRRPAPPAPDEAQTALSVGLDLGILPTFLAQMGMSVSLVASRGQQSGDARIALVATTELPVDWSPHERPFQHPRGVSVNQTDTADYVAGYYSGGSGVPRSSLPPGSGGGGGGGSPLTPITPTPPVPEPATLALLGVGAVLALVRRRTR